MELLDRIKYLMKLNNLSASAFADKIDVQRSSISHLLSGRNKPSLEFINKVLLAFPKISADWLLSGKTEVSTSNFDEPLIQSEKKTPTPTLSSLSGKQVKKVVIFYTDNTFEEIIKE